jgi:hypothetical protein
VGVKNEEFYAEFKSIEKVAKIDLNELVTKK